MSAGSKEQAVRARRAACLVLTGLILLAVAGAWEARADESAIDGKRASALIVGSIGEAGSAESVLEELSRYESELPPSFEEELFIAESEEAVYASEDGAVFAFLVDEGAEEAFARICVSMEAANWRKTESGIEHCASFVKEGGVYRWAFVGCYVVGETTTVVVQVQEG